MANPQMFVEVVTTGAQAAVTVVGHGDNVGDAFGDDEDFVIVLNSSANSANAAITDVLVGTPVTPGLAANSAILSNTTASGDILFAVADASGNSQGLLHLDGSAGMLSVGEDATGYDVKFFGDTTGKYMLWDESEDDLIVIGDVGIGAGTGSGALTVTNTGSSTPTALLLRNLTAVGSADTGVNIVWHGNDTGQSMASQAVAWEGTDNNDVYMTFQTRTSDSITEKMRIKSTGEVDLQGISTGGLINVGASGNNWTATAINIAGTNPNITSEATNGNGAAQLTVKVPASGSGGDAGILIGEGNAGGAAGNQGYYLQYRPGSGYFRFLSTNIDGSATNGDIWRVADSGTVMLLNDDHGTNFDYVCDSCGRAEIEFFECCGTVAWHDDVLALREMALNREGLEHMAKLGVMDISNNDDGVEWIGLNLQGAQHFTWSAMHQMYERINELETKLEALGV